MKVGKTKCGIMPVRGSSFQIGVDYNGYPVIKSYKYLGLVLSNDLSAGEHLKIINQKFNFLSYKLSAIRKKDFLKLNLRLFKVFVMPMYRLAYTQYPRM